LSVCSPVEFSGTVRTPYQRSAGYPVESPLYGMSLVFCKFLWWDIANHRVMILGRCEVLAQRQNIAAGLPQIAHNLQNLIFFLS
jgi:hypothetical protein